ncbi:M48 family metallopeptidase [Thauera linaloolentis]|uniref:Ste24 endopeptidase n=1 Tax=Thauera linaloolentis (strain DSM 12138 / JCM 21573 / CCUG 41526 / CIP 105981 / IAM 15112 / NBRC 102519 / 47Lol) TaxID=1123367 RepID=N6Z144_THAL4|nr:M48 family metallopeptidase [Thauera linaloolentis]ENO88133.1 Ste24 endopeptidase [Thauera linaloolentis 47Lol = DSM 12138]MCM8565825.1 M48 family metallopeptidase [Thauera linaloolentis]
MHADTASSFASGLAALFVTLLLLSLFVRAGLMHRQIRHVRACRGSVPQAFAASITLAAHQRAADYTAARMRLTMAEITVNASFVLLLTLGGGLQAIHDAWSAVFAPGGIAHGVALLATLGALGWLVDLPFVLLRTFIIEKRFGFNRMTPALFAADAAREIVLAAAIGLPLLAVLLWLASAMGGLWWLWVWVFWMAFNLLVMLVWPTFIAPLFNRFTPLADEALKARVEGLLARCGFRSQGLFVMDGSRRSAHGNAYFTGFGASKRIVFFDTLLDKLDADEVEAVLAHELGHFRHRHIVKRLAVLAPASLALLALLGWLSGQSWFFAGLGVGATDTATALALFFLALPAFIFPLGPLMSHWSRVHEFEADAYAAQQTRASDLVAALVKLYRDNASTLTPDPLYSRFFDSHPPAAIRIARLQSLQP